MVVQIFTTSIIIVIKEVEEAQFKNLAERNTWNILPDKNDIAIFKRSKFLNRPLQRDKKGKERELEIELFDFYRHFHFVT